MKIGFFGSGNMVKAIAEGIRKNHPSVIMFFYSPSGVSSKQLAEKIKGEWVINLEDMPNDLDLYVLGFKPQNLADFHFNFQPNSKIVSILAGTTIQNLKKKFNDSNFCRIMPNTPSSVYLGMNLFYFEKDFDKKIQDQIVNLFQSIGEIVILKNENEVDLLTPFSGSGPGIIFELALYLENALKELKIDGIDSKKIIGQTFLGSSQLMLTSQYSLAELRDQVTSKKGVTFEALETLRKNKVDEIMKLSIHNALSRIEELKQGK